MNEPLSIVEEQSIFSVKEISLLLKKRVEESFNHIHVRGEVSGLKRHTSGHTYFALKDQDAVIDAVCWRGSTNGASIHLEDGLEIVATGRLTTYPARSKYQMVVEKFEAAGQGALLKLLEERKQRLAQEGLFDQSRKKPIPAYPQTIGVVTSPTGAVIRDILHRIQDRYPCHIIVWPVLVQGQGAADQIAKAIAGFNQLASPPDLLIVARGGGSLEDLWAFNEEEVVRAVAASTIPLISAVGHETDTTLIDYAADLRAPTPTAAAELSVPVLAELWAFLQDRGQRVNNLMSNHLQKLSLHLQGLSRGLPDPQRIVAEKVQRLDDWGERLTSALKNFWHRNELRLDGVNQRFRQPETILQLSQHKLSLLSQQFYPLMQRSLEQRQQTFETLSERLTQASYERVLERGFCWATSQDGHSLTSTKDVKKGMAFDLRFKDGIIPVVENSASPKRARPADVPSPAQGRLF